MKTYKCSLLEEAPAYAKGLDDSGTKPTIHCKGAVEGVGAFRHSILPDGPRPLDGGSVAAALVIS